MPLTIKTERKPATYTTTGRGQKSSTPPGLSAAFGTAGCNRGWKFSTRLGDAGYIDWLQCIFCYDFNQETVEKINRLAKQQGGSPGPSVLLPRFVRNVQGFLRNPRAFEGYYGLINRDMDKMISDIKGCSDDLGASAQLVVEFLGFGGHSILGCIGHRKLREALPEAIFLPVLLLPSDPALQELMRQETWDEYEKHLAGVTVLITDNNVGEPTDVDDRLAVGLASIESAAHSDPASSSLAETIGSLAPHSGGWLGMSVVKHRLPSRNSWGLHLPLRQRKLVQGRDNELAWLVKKSTQDAMAPEAQLARHDLPADDMIQRMVVSLPLRDEDLEEFKQTVMSQLKAEGFFEKHPKLAISICSANFPDRPNVPYWPRRDKKGLPNLFMMPIRLINNIFGFLRNTVSAASGKIVSRCADDLYAYAVRIYPLQGAIKSLDLIMGQGPAVGQAEMQTGLGSGYYSNRMQRAEMATSGSERLWTPTISANSQKRS